MANEDQKLNISLHNGVVKHWLLGDCSHKNASTAGSQSLVFIIFNLLKSCNSFIINQGKSSLPPLPLLLRE